MLNPLSNLNYRYLILGNWFLVTPNGKPQVVFAHFVSGIFVLFLLLSTFYLLNIILFSLRESKRQKNQEREYFKFSNYFSFERVKYSLLSNFIYYLVITALFVSVLLVQIDTRFVRPI